ncbi:sodium-dependent neutral amino acid transporter B(0) family protein [Teladorsagia circumcincta]|uniref:Transporter n=1 Tax=Teladorsagia circumcincta TaxID=45464 RepID=A0A2G9UJH6_TELCI|nr:sodium-dependent neutral amino acid transporter B(0) family protein [Teladorsagia circumcincta]
MSPGPPDLLDIPGKRATFTSGSEEEIRLGSRVTFNDQSVNIEGVDFQMNEASNQSATFHDDEHVQKREQWDNKTQFYMGVVSYAVGLGNVWRFPYLCQKNGGGAFLIPYVIMMVLLGLPLFLIELGIGQRLRTGPMGVWNAIHPYLGGLGVSAAVVSYLVALYYNVIITWCLYYLKESFALDLPWGTCPRSENGTIDKECAMSSSTTMYFWNRQALDTTGSIGDLDSFNQHITISLIVAWFLIYLCVMKGIKSSGKVMYATATFPYLVTTIFLIRSVTLDGAMKGLWHMINPDLHKLYSPTVWLEAATQIFYSMGLGFGGLIAFGSYNPIKNDCKKDAKWLALCNVLTSLYTALVVFCVLGYMGHNTMNTCIEKDMEIMTLVFPENFSSVDDVRKMFTQDQYIELMQNKFTGEFTKMAAHSQMCNYATIISEAAEGTGLAFVVFTEAILKFPFPPAWSILFFLMLLSLGLGSMFGTLEGVITSLNDSHLITVTKPVLTAVLCASACLVGLLFSTRAGQYWVALFDSFAGSYALMCVAFFETKLKETEYPIWAMFIALGMVLMAILPTFSVWFLRYFKIWKLEADIPAASKCLGTTQSTTYMLKSEQSFNRMTESNVSVAEMEPITTPR